MNKDKIKNVCFKVLKCIGIFFILLFLVGVFFLIIGNTKKPKDNTDNTIKENISLTANADGLGGVENDYTDYDGWTTRAYLMNTTLNLYGITPTAEFNNFTFQTANSSNGTRTNRYGLRFTSTYAQWYTDSNGGRANFYNYSSNTWTANYKYWWITSQPNTTVLAWLNANGTWLNAPVVNYVTFYVNNQSFTVVDETTWSDFVGSVANTIGLYIQDNYVYNNLGQHLLDGANQFVSASSMIINNVYYTYLVTDSFYVGAESYSFVPNSTWTQFVSSTFNVDNVFTIVDNMVMYNGLSVIDSQDYPCLARDLIISNSIYTTTEYVDYEILYLRLLEEYNKFSSYYWLNQYNVDMIEIVNNASVGSGMFAGDDGAPIVNFTGGTYERVDFSNLLNYYLQYLHNDYNVSSTNNIQIRIYFNSPLTISDLGNYFIATENISSIRFLAPNGAVTGNTITINSDNGVFDLSQYDFFTKYTIDEVILNYSTLEYTTAYTSYISFNGSNIDVISANSYEKGREVGRGEGYEIGYDEATQYWIDFYKGEIQRLQDQIDSLASGEVSFNSLFWGIGAVPFGILSSILNFNILGVNIFGLLTGLLTALIVIWLFKRLLK